MMICKRRRLLHIFHSYHNHYKYYGSELVYTSSWKTLMNDESSITRVHLYTAEMETSPFVIVPVDRL